MGHTAILYYLYRTIYQNYSEIKTLFLKCSGGTKEFGGVSGQWDRKEKMEIRGHRGGA